MEVYPDNPVPSLPRTLEMFNRALIVIAPHGAGESNLLFSEAGTVMIEGLCSAAGRANYCYRNLAANLGHRYYGIYNRHSCYGATPDVIIPPVEQVLDLYFKTHNVKTFVRNIWKKLIKKLRRGGGDMKYNLLRLVAMSDMTTFYRTRGQNGLLPLSPDPLLSVALLFPIRVIVI